MMPLDFVEAGRIAFLGFGFGIVGAWALVIIAGVFVVSCPAGAGKAISRIGERNFWFALAATGAAISLTLLAACTDMLKHTPPL